MNQDKEQEHSDENIINFAAGSSGEQGERANAQMTGNKSLHDYLLENSQVINI